MLKSVLRMDEDHSVMRMSQGCLKVRDKEFCEFEAHIFFDDAFEMCDEDEEEQAVKLLLEPVL